MSKENENEIRKDFSPKFLPVVDEKIISSVSKKLFKNPKKTIDEAFAKMNKENPGFHKFLSWKANHYFNPCSFLLGNSFVYLTISEKYKEIKKPFLQISHEIFEDLSREIEDTNETFQKKLDATVMKTIEDIENNFYIHRHFDENSKTEFIEVDVDNKEKLAQIMGNSNKEYFKIENEFKKRSFSIIPPPNFYNKENYSLMRSIKFISNYTIVPDTAAGSFFAGTMLTYEILRRQAESDYLEEKFK